MTDKLKNVQDALEFAKSLFVPEKIVPQKQPKYLPRTRRTVRSTHP